MGMSTEEKSKNIQKMQTDVTTMSGRQGRPEKKLPQLG